MMQTPVPKLNSSSAAANALVGLWTIALSAFIIATLCFGRSLLIPLALAALLAFLLVPFVTRLERWLGRVGAVLLAVALILAAAGAGGWVLTQHLVDLAIKLPDYKQNIQTKLRSLKVPSTGRFAKFSEMVEELKRDLPGAENPETTQVPGQPETSVLTAPSVQPAVPVQVVGTSKANPFQLGQAILAPLLTRGLFVALELELLSNNVIEPWLCGSSTGVSPIALIFAAVCWTWLWGPVGLVLATPMTVCLVVMGRHIPQLSFLSVLRDSGANDVVTTLADAA